MTDNWHNEKNSIIENWHINSSRKDDRELKVTERPIVITYKDNKKDFDERKDYSQEVQKMIDIVKVSSIERQKNNNRKDDIIETIQKNPSAIIQKKKQNIIDEYKVDIIDGDKERGIERQQGNSTLTNSKETILKELDIEKT